MNIVEEMNIISTLNSQVKELPDAMLRWNVSFKPSMGGLEEH
jgi:hypothetical protein